MWYLAIYRFLRLRGFLAAGILFFGLPGNAYPLDVECKFSGERKPTVYKDLVSGENISISGGVEDNIKKKEVYWGDDYVTIIVEYPGIATLIVINREDMRATKRVTRAGISRGEAWGWCQFVEPAK